MRLLVGKAGQARAKPQSSACDHRVGDRADIALVGAVEGRTILEEELLGAAAVAASPKRRGSVPPPGAPARCAISAPPPRRRHPAVDRMASGTPISCTVRMPPRTSMEQRSVAPVKSSATAPSSMARSLFWSGDQKVAVGDAHGKPAGIDVATAPCLPRVDPGALPRQGVAGAAGVEGQHVSQHGAVARTDHPVGTPPVVVQGIQSGQIRRHECGVRSQSVGLGISLPIWLRRKPSSTSASSRSCRLRHTPPVTVIAA